MTAVLRFPVRQFREINLDIDEVEINVELAWLFSHNPQPFINQLLAPWRTETKANLLHPVQLLIIEREMEKYMRHCPS